jgi:hypothetical protein
MKAILGKGFLLLGLVFCMNISAVQAQDEEITDTDLYNYALLQQVLDQMKGATSDAVQNLIDQQEGFTVKRYQELASGGDDEAKLKQLGANDFEVQFMGLIVKEKSKRESAIKEVYSTLASKMVGVKAFKAMI